MATRRYDLPGGQLEVLPMNPVELQLKLAQLAALTAQPGAEQQRIDIERQNAQRALEQLRNQYNLGKSGQAEDVRYHTGTLDQARAALGEEGRYHQAQVGESQAERAQREKIAAETLRSNALNDVLMHAGPQLESATPGITAKLAATANPEIARVIETAQTAVEADKIKQSIVGLTKPEQISGVTKGLPAEKANAVWNAFKAANPTVLGPPPATSQGTTVPTTPTADVLRTAGIEPTAAFSPVPLATLGQAAPTSVTTVDRGAVTPSMGVVNPTTGGTTPIPGATRDYTGGSGETTALNLPPPEGQLASSPSRGPLLNPKPVTFPPVVPTSATAAPATNVAEVPTPLHGAGSEFGPPQVNVDAALQALVGNPTMEDLKRRQRSAQPAVLTPYRTNQY